MITFGPNYGKLRTSLQLATTRLKILQLKKLELVEKLKLEVAMLIKSGKYMKAELSAQTIVRDKAAVEAMELIEVYCNQILDRYELFQQMNVPDISLVIPITSLIWVAPYYQNYVEELKVISKQFNVKYGPHACKRALTNKTGKVNPELIERVRLFTPSNEKVENCLKNVCSKYGIVYRKEYLTSDDNNHEEKNLRTSFVPESDSQFSDKEIEIHESFSRKKRVIRNIFKHKAKKADLQDSEISDKTPDITISKQNSHQNLPGNETEGKCEAITDLLNSSDDSSEADFNIVESLQDKSWRETENNIPSNISLFDDYCETKPESPDVSTPLNSRFCTDSFRVIYPDPPPPYSYQCLPENKTYDRSGTWDDFFMFQLPSCPTENPGSSSAPQEETKRK